MRSKTIGSSQRHSHSLKSLDNFNHTIQKPVLPSIVRGLANSRTSAFPVSRSPRCAIHTSTAPTQIDFPHGPVASPTPLPNALHRMNKDRGVTVNASNLAPTTVRRRTAVQGNRMPWCGEMSTWNFPKFGHQEDTPKLHQTFLFHWIWVMELGLQ